MWRKQPTDDSRGGCRPEMGARLRRLAHGCVAASLALMALAGQSPAAADELVRFSSAQPLLPESAGPAPRTIPLRGYLTRPKGKGPFPAVILLHSCLGLPSDRSEIGRTLAGWGYVALFVDDFATRGLSQTCLVDFPEGLADAFGALDFLAGRPEVDKERIAALGFSQGGDTALEIAAWPGLASAFAIPRGLRFRAVAAYYPPCGNRPDARLRLPTLILVGEADSVTPARDCARLAAANPAAELALYRGAAHVFDDPAFAGGKRLFGMWLQYDRAAARQSRSALRRFLAANLAR